jgi:mxaL protein
LLRAPAGTWPWLVAALALLLAWADPKWPQTQQRWQHIVIVDITQSMNTRDMQLPLPGGGGAVANESRLAFVRQALQRALADLPCGSSLGLGVFTEYRSLLLLAPLEVCAHYDELLAVIGRLDGRMAWASSSEVARGVESALQVANQVAAKPSVVFISDGHEAPPLRGGALPTITLPPHPAAGWVAGVGGDTPMPIPKFDPTGRALGYWQADEVMQTDPVSLGRTVGGARQTLVDTDGSPLEVFRASGLEHLSSLKEAHLQVVAQATGLQYRRLRDSADLSAIMRAPQLARALRVPVSWRWLPALAALLLLVWPFLPRRIFSWNPLKKGDRR